MKGKIEKADSFLGRYAGISYKEFINQYKNGIEKTYENKFLTLFSSFKDLEDMGVNIGNILETIKDNSSTFIVPLENDIVNSKIKRTLDRYITAKDKNFDLTTLVSRELLNEIHKGNTDCKIFTGKKYLDTKSGIFFDVLLNIEDLRNLPNINGKETPIVPYFSYKTIKDPQEYFLSLNKKFPAITKIFRGLEGNNPVLFKLKDDTFTLCSYLSLNENGNIKSSP
jgi:hypothetical protein